MTKKQWRNVNKGKLTTRLAVLFVVLLLVLLIFQTPALQRILFLPENTIMIEGVGDFEYALSEVWSMRPDIFQEGRFSIFDILAHLDNRSKIDMNYHFDENMNTYVIRYKR